MTVLTPPERMPRIPPEKMTEAQEGGRSEAW